VDGSWPAHWVHAVLSSRRTMPISASPSALARRSISRSFEEPFLGCCLLARSSRTWILAGALGAKFAEPSFELF